MSGTAQQLAGLILDADLPKRQAEEIARLRTALEEKSKSSCLFQPGMCREHEIACLHADLAAARGVMRQIVNKDKRYDVNCTSQDTGEDGPCGKIARAFLEENKST